MGTDTSSETVQEHQAEHVERAAERAEESQSPQSDTEQPYSSRHDQAVELSDQDETDDATGDTDSGGEGVVNPEDDAARTDELRADDRKSASVAVETARDTKHPDPAADTTTESDHSHLEPGANTSMNGSLGTRSGERERLEQSTVPEPETGDGNVDSTTDEEFEHSASNLDDTTATDEQGDDNGECETENGTQPGYEADSMSVTAEDSTVEIWSTDKSEVDEVDDELSATATDDRSTEWGQGATEDLRSTDESASAITDMSLPRDDHTSDADDGAVQPSDAEHEPSAPDSRSREADDGSTFDKALSFVNEVLYTEHGLNVFRWFDENVFDNYSRPPKEESSHLYQRAAGTNVGDAGDSVSARLPDCGTAGYRHDHEVAHGIGRSDSVARAGGDCAEATLPSSVNIFRVHGELDELQDAGLGIVDGHSSLCWLTELGDHDQPSEKTAETLAVATSPSDVRYAEDDVANVDTEDGEIDQISSVDSGESDDESDNSAEYASEAEGEGTEAREVETKCGNKVMKQMRQRDWTQETVDETIRNPHRTAETIDERWRKDGTRNNDPATAYLNEDGSYVVRNNRTGDIVQVSDRADPDWRSKF